MNPTVGAPQLSDRDLQELIGLIHEADSVELKLTVPDEDRRSTVVALGLDPLDAAIRQVYFFDTPDLALERAGVVVRARRIQRGDDSVVKLRPVVPSELPDEVRKSQFCKVEVDAIPGGHVCSASIKGVPKTPVQEVAAGSAPIRKLFSKEQRAFFADNAPEGIGLDDLSILGPIFILKLKGTPAGYARKMVVELWLFPDGTRILELSTKCAPSEGFQVAAEARAFLAERGIKTTGAQTTKTRKSLQFFAKQPSRA
jgi:hypothetical protein